MAGGVGATACGAVRDSRSTSARTAKTEALLRDGEFVADIADALGVSRETIRRFRDERGIADAREIRQAKGAAFRRESQPGA